MEEYTGTKTIKAETMTRGNYNSFQGWDIPKGENPDDPGYLVGYSNAEGNFDGPMKEGCYHISWSPKDVFEAAYGKTSNIKTLHNSTVSGAHVNVKDIKVVGNGDSFRLLCKASSESEGWMKSTKAMDVSVGCVVQVTTQQRNPDGSYALAEAITFVPDVMYVDDIDSGRRLIPTR